MARVHKAPSTFSGSGPFSPSKNSPSAPFYRQATLPAGSDAAKFDEPAIFKNHAPHPIPLRLVEEAAPSHPCREVRFLSFADVAKRHNTLIKAPGVEIKRN